MAKGINVINKETINSYQEVINAINEEIKKGTTEITIDIIYQAGEDNIIRMSDQKIKEEWGKLKERVTGEPINSEDIYVRNHGRNGSGKDKLIELLKNVVFKGRNIRIDRCNNSQPKSMLEKAFKGTKYEDYQISHLFEERTNNPLLFTAPWMICYTPKIIDPFTGHETTGHDSLRQRFIKWAFEKNDEYIKEYNEIIMHYWKILAEEFKDNQDNQDNQDNNDYWDKNNKYTRFAKQMIVALAPIIKEAELCPKNDRTQFYLDIFNNLSRREDTEWSIELLDKALNTYKNDHIKNKVTKNRHHP